MCLVQIDLRDDPKTIAKLNDMKEKPVATEQGQKLAKEVSQDSESVDRLWRSWVKAVHCLGDTASTALEDSGKPSFSPVECVGDGSWPHTVNL